MKIKIEYISGLRNIVLKELKEFKLPIIDEINNSLYLTYSSENLIKVKNLKSITQASLISQSPKYHPVYLANHKSILGNIIDLVLEGNKKLFKSFKISCAGTNSPEIRNIIHFLEQKYNLTERTEADLKIFIRKLKNFWEIGAQITPRPLTLRDYRVANINGGLNPTIAYSINSIAKLRATESYLNIFSGSGTLLIEAALICPNLSKLIGFDNNKKHLSIAIQNIKKANLIRKIELKAIDIFSQPDFGQFDVITSDLPFGMNLSPEEDLTKLYQVFINYCQSKLKKGGRLIIYTAKYDLLESIILKSSFKISKSWSLSFMTKANSYLKSRIFLCEFK